MADDERREGNEAEGSASKAASGGESKSGGTGDPGRTPGTAEGDRQTVEEDLGER